MEEQQHVELPRHHIARTDGSDFLRADRQWISKVRRRIEFAARSRPTNSSGNLCLVVGCAGVAADEFVRVLHGATGSVGDTHGIHAAGVDGGD